MTPLNNSEIIHNLKNDKDFTHYSNKNSRLMVDDIVVEKSRVRNVTTNVTSDEVFD